VERRHPWQRSELGKHARRWRLLGPVERVILAGPVERVLLALLGYILAHIWRRASAEQMNVGGRRPTQKIALFLEEIPI